VTKQVAITTTSAAVRRRWTSDYGENYDCWQYIKYTCGIVVTGEDLAGSIAGMVGRATLKVK
jgi:hypothetical protein